MKLLRLGLCRRLGEKSFEAHFGLDASRNDRLHSSVVGMFLIFLRISFSVEATVCLTRDAHVVVGEIIVLVSGYAFIAKARFVSIPIVDSACFLRIRVCQKIGNEQGLKLSKCKL